MHELIWVLTGLLAGLLVGRALRGEGYGLMGSLLIGTAGGVVGGWLLDFLHVPGAGGLAFHFLSSLVGATVFVVGVRVLDGAARTVAHHNGHLEGGELEAALRRLGAIERRVLAKLVSRGTVTTNAQAEFEQQATFGQRVADQVASFGGSWTFIGIFVLIMAVWMSINMREIKPFDPYPFILLNLLLSCLAALQAPVIMMSQNRQAARDRIDAQNDYKVNLNAEMQILSLHAKFDALIAERLQELETRLAEQGAILERLARDPGDGQGEGASDPS